MNTTHLSDIEIERFCRRSLAADELMAFAHHLGECPDCQRRVAVAGGARTAMASIETAVGLVGHVRDDELRAFVDGGPDVERRREISSHLAVCGECADELRDLQAFALEIQSRQSRARWLYSTLAAAAAVVIVTGSVFLFLDRAPERAPLANRPGRGVSGEAGTADAVASLSPADRDLVRAAITNRRLQIPAIVNELAGRRGTLLGAPPAVPEFRVVGPAATVVRGTSPTFRWTAAAADARYVVTVQGPSGDTFSSPSLEGVEWTPDRPLAAGATYTWQVAAALRGRELLAPLPPQPPARFSILDAASTKRLEAVPASRLVRGIVFASAGLMDDGERELSGVGENDEGFDVAQALLTQLRQARQPR